MFIKVAAAAITVLVSIPLTANFHLSQAAVQDGSENSLVEDYGMSPDEAMDTIELRNDDNFLDPSLASDDVFYMYVGGDGYTKKYQPRTTPEEGGESGSLAGPIGWGGCFFWDDDDKIIAKYDSGRPPMARKYLNKTQLRCGNEDKFGYRHIVKGHKIDWMRETPSKGNSDWEGLAAFSIRETMASPIAYCEAQGNIRHVGLIQLRRKNGSLIKSFFVKSGYRADTKNVITGFPAKNKNCPNDPL